MRRFLALGFAALLFAGGTASARQTASPDTANSEVRKAVDAGNTRYIADFAKLGAAALAALYVPLNPMPPLVRKQSRPLQQRAIRVRPDSPGMTCGAVFKGHSSFTFL
jgi:hypothetical protein